MKSHWPEAASSVHTFIVRTAFGSAFAVVSVRDLELPSPTTSTFELDPDTFTINRHARYIGQRSFRSNVIVRTNRMRHARSGEAGCNTSPTAIVR